ncbi:hypothetical protein [Micromonospora echinospora]
MIEAQRRFDLLTQRARHDVIEASVEHARTLYRQDQMEPGLAAQFQAAAAALAGEGTNADDTRRAWSALRERVRDVHVSRRLAEITDSLVLGATSGGEVSTATLTFPDNSYLIMMDHGLSNLTWLIAQLFVVSRRTPLLGHPPPGNPVGITAAAQALRLTTARIAGGGRAGVNPSLVLGRDELALAGALVREIDIFVLAHEAAHILLGHFSEDHSGLTAVGHPSQLLGRRPHEETAADLLAVTLQLDDMLSTGEGDDRVIALRLTAVRLFLALLELYERSMFVVQPTSHPPAAARWRTIVSERLTRWFDDSGRLQYDDIELVRTLRELDAIPRLSDAAAVHSGMGERLDRALWSFHEWSQVAALGHFLMPAPAEALAALTRWPGWPADADVESEIAGLVAEVLAAEEARAIVRAAVSGEQVVSRLAAAAGLTARADAARKDATTHTDPFPSWAIAAIAIDALTETIARWQR